MCVGNIQNRGDDPRPARFRTRQEGQGEIWGSAEEGSRIVSSRVQTEASVIGQGLH
jgi:hypothetical protein